MSGPPGTLTRRRLLTVGATLGFGAAVGGLTGCSSSAEQATPPQPRRRKPNVIVITADDMRADELRWMPHTQRLLVRDGTNFLAGRHNIALCSPARAGFLTGQLSKRHGIRSQRDSFRKGNDVNRTLPVWMQEAGYQTAIVGKYLTEAEGRSTPPGWDVRRQLAEANQEQYGYQVWDGTDLLQPEPDQTAYLQSEVVEFLELARAPFFLWFTPTANHSPYQAPPGHEQDPVPELEDTREGDMDDKPPWLQRLTPISDEVLASIHRQEQVRVRELLGLDDTIDTIVRTLRSAGTLDNTVIIFTSDNGLLLGEHQIPPFTKNMPYEESVRSPCIVRGGGFDAAEVTNPAHLSVDLTATCVELAGATPNLELDGISLREVVATPAGTDRHLLYDRDDRDGFTFGAQGPPPGSGVFTRSRKLIRWEDPARTVELYDLEVDALEQRNVADDPTYAEERAELEASLDHLLAT